MDTSAIVGWSGLVISIIGIIYSAVNHKHCKILICGRRLDFAIDVNSTENNNIEENYNIKRDEEKKKKEDEEKKKKEEEEKKKEEEERKKISYTPRVFKIQPLNF
jgi:hypothetical protein